MMRIVDVNEFYSPTGGGVRTYIDRKMSILAEMGHELILPPPAPRTWSRSAPAAARSSISRRRA
jgi:alpha-1,6-mannosyltransferase